MTTTSKREPRSGEPVLHHRTLDTGEVQRLAIVTENFSLGAVVRADLMLRTGEEVTGLRLVPVGVQGGPQFTVYAGREAITRNSLEVLSESELQLNTQLLPGAAGVTKDLLLASADAEQCAAIALAIGAAEMDFPGFGT